MEIRRQEAVCSRQGVKKWGMVMGKYLIVSRVETLREHMALSRQYGVGFEINDFFDPEVLDDPERQQRIIEAYLEMGLPEGSTMHGAFLDVVVFSQDPLVRQVSEQRMRQSMEIARKLRVKGVVFHTNVNPMLSSREYDMRAIDMTTDYLKILLTDFPDIEIYLENMFDASPDIMVRISERLRDFPNYGVCFDYAHAVIYGFPVAIWIRQLAPYMKHIHINDNDLKHDLHLALGKGKIIWSQFFDYYDTYFSNCSVLIETTPPEAQKISLEFLTEMERHGYLYGE